MIWLSKSHPPRKVRDSLCSCNIKRAQQIVSDITHRAFGIEPQTRDRFIRLTYMSLRRFIGTKMLADCKVYWEHHSTLVTCFSDLKIFVQDFSPEDAADFYKFVRTQSMDTLSNSNSNEVCIFPFL
jgi:N-terminal acetyltransferase B complex non-catalytic subunit